LATRSVGFLFPDTKENPMKTFKSISSVDRVRNDPLHDTIKKLVTKVIAEYSQYRPEDDGYLVLIEPDDMDRVLGDLDRLASVTKS
jgi:hypothetical protein